MRVTKRMRYAETGEEVTISITGNKCLIEAIFDLLWDVEIMEVD